MVGALAGGVTQALPFQKVNPLDGQMSQAVLLMAPLGHVVGIAGTTQALPFQKVGPVAGQVLQAGLFTAPLAQGGLTQVVPFQTVCALWPKRPQQAALFTTVKVSPAT
jgi:hypothetical protein